MNTNPKSHTPKSSGNPSEKVEGDYISKEELYLEWDIQQTHLNGSLVSHNSGYKIRYYIIEYYSGTTSRKEI